MRVDVRSCAEWVVLCTYDVVSRGCMSRVVYSPTLRALRETCYPGAQPRAPTLESALTSLSAFEARHKSCHACRRHPPLRYVGTLPDDIFIAQNAASVRFVGFNVSRAFRF